MGFKCLERLVKDHISLQTAWVKTRNGNLAVNEIQRLKESDRISAMKEELEKFGARIEVIDGQNGGTVNVLPAELHAPKVPLSSHNDHRIAMSLSVLALRFGGEIEGAEAVRKSMPDFFENLETLGAHITKT